MEKFTDALVWIILPIWFVAQHPNVYGDLPDAITEWLAATNSAAQ